MKYVVGLVNGVRSGIMFRSHINHADAAVLFNEVQGAGFVRITGFNDKDQTPTLTCFGESTTLNIKSRGEKDSVVLLTGFMV